MSITSFSETLCLHAIYIYVTGLIILTFVIGVNETYSFYHYGRPSKDLQLYVLGVALWPIAIVGLVAIGVLYILFNAMPRGVSGILHNVKKRKEDAD